MEKKSNFINICDDILFKNHGLMMSLVKQVEEDDFDKYCILLSFQKKIGHYKYAKLDDHKNSISMKVELHTARGFFFALKDVGENFEKSLFIKPIEVGNKTYNLTRFDKKTKNFVVNDKYMIMTDNGSERKICTISAIFQEQDKSVSRRVNLNVSKPNLQIPIFLDVYTAQSYASSGIELCKIGLNYKFNDQIRRIGSK